MFVEVRAAYTYIFTTAEAKLGKNKIKKSPNLTRQIRTNSLKTGNTITAESPILQHMYIFTCFFHRCRCELF